MVLTEHHQNDFSTTQDWFYYSHPALIAATTLNVHLSNQNSSLQPFTPTSTCQMSSSLYASMADMDTDAFDSALSTSIHPLQSQLDPRNSFLPSSNLDFSLDTNSLSSLGDPNMVMGLESDASTYPYQNVSSAPQSDGSAMSISNTSTPGTSFPNSSGTSIPPMTSHAMNSTSYSMNPNQIPFPEHISPPPPNQLNRASPLQKLTNAASSPMGNDMLHGYTSFSTTSTPAMSHSSVHSTPTTSLMPSALSTPTMPTMPSNVTAPTRSPAVSSLAPSSMGTSATGIALSGMLPTASGETVSVGAVVDSLLQK